jgi:hypothetical protein
VTAAPLALSLSSLEFDGAAVAVAINLGHSAQRLQCSVHHRKCAADEGDLRRIVGKVIASLIEMEIKIATTLKRSNGAVICE